MGTLWKRRRCERESSFSCSSVLHWLASHVARDISEHEKSLARSNRISLSDFSFNFNAYGDQECFFNFRFRNSDVLRMVNAVAGYGSKTHMSRNRYAVTLILATCLILCRIASASRWMDLEMTFWKATASSVGDLLGGFRKHVGDT